MGGSKLGAHLLLTWDAALSTSELERHAQHEAYNVSSIEFACCGRDSVLTVHCGQHRAGAHEVEVTDTAQVCALGSEEVLSLIHI